MALKSLTASRKGESITREPQKRLANGNMNKLLPQDEVVHSWYRFVLSFPPHLVRHYVDAFGFNEKSVVLDPFCGTGTTLVECKKLGIPSVGIEAHPFIHFAASVKVDWNPDPSLLKRHSQRIAEKAKRVLETRGLLSDASRRGKKERVLKGLESLDPEAERLLLTGSISPILLQRLWSC